MSLSSGFDMPKSIFGRKFSFNDVSFDADDAEPASSTCHNAQCIEHL